MTREQAINSMISHGFTVEQAGEIIKAVTPQLSSELEKNSKKLEKGTTKNDLEVEKIIDEIEEEFEKVDIPIMDKLTLFAKVQNSLYRCAELRNSKAPTGSTTKNDLGVEKIVDVLGSYTDLDIPYKHKIAEDILNNLPSVTPQEQQTFKWCTDCKEYDQEKHCCHRWSKVIRDTVEEMKQEQEPILDKIRAEIETKYGQCKLCEFDSDYDGVYTDIGDIADILQIIDKYKAESEKA